MSGPGHRIGVAHHVLDHQLIDSGGERCGNVDDVALAVDEQGRLQLTAILCGTEVLRRRCRARWMRWLVGLWSDHAVEVPWQHVSSVRDRVDLALPARQLGLARGEQRAADLLARMLGPDATAAQLGPSGQVAEPTAPDPEAIVLSRLLGRDVVDAGSGERLGRVHEVIAQKDGRVLGEAAGAAWVVTELAIGRTAFFGRLGIAHGRGRHDLVEVERVVEWTAHDPIQVRSAQR